MLSQTIGRIGEWVAGSHLLIAIAASAFTGSAYLQLSIPPDYPLIIFIGFATLFTYNLQNLMGRYRSARVKDHFTPWHPFIIYAGLGVAGMSVSLVGMEDRSVVTWFIVPGTLSFLYSTPLFTFRRVRITLREIPWLKIYLILFVWLWVTAFIPYFNVHDGLTPDFILFCMQRAFFVFALLLPFDIRDLNTDYAFQKTIPQRFGVRRSLRLGVVAVALYGMIAGFRWLAGPLEVMTLLGLLLTGLLTSALILKTHEDRSPLYFTFWIDSMLWVQFLLIWLLK
ncbi:MAG: hypothetical protein WD035_03220 [Balneolaceae bacterium]